MTFDEWWEKYGCIYGDCKDFGAKAWNAAIAEAREAALAVGRDAREAAKAKDATDYVAGYEDAAVDADEAIRELLTQQGDNSK